MIYPQLQDTTKWLFNECHSLFQILVIYVVLCKILPQNFWSYFNFQQYRPKIRPCLCKVINGHLQFPIHNFTHFSITQYERFSPILTQKFKISGIFNQIKHSLLLPLKGIFHIHWHCMADCQQNFSVNSDLECQVHNKHQCTWVHVRSVHHLRDFILVLHGRLPPNILTQFWSWHIYNKASLCKYT